MQYPRLIKSFSDLKGDENWTQRRVRIPFHIKRWCKNQRIKDSRASTEKATLRDMYLSMFLNGLAAWEEDATRVIFSRYDFKELDKHENMFFPNEKYKKVQHIQERINEVNFGNDIDGQRTIYVGANSGDPRIIESIIVQFIELGYRMNLKPAAKQIN
jgi:hypothetical protein